MAEVRLSSVAVSILLVMFMFYVLTLTSMGGVNVVTLPWISIMTAALAATLIFAIYGRYVLPVIFKKFGVKIPLGDGYIDDCYFIVGNYDTESGFKYSGFSVVKLIPTTPSVDLRDDDKKLLLRNVESFILTLPSDIEFGIMRTIDPEIKKLLKKIESEIAKFQSRKGSTKNPGLQSKYDRKIEELVRERERILKSNPMSSVIYIKVHAKGRSQDEVKEKLKNLIEQVESSVHSLQCIPKVIKYFDLQDFIEAQLISRAIRYVTK